MQLETSAPLGYFLNNKISGNNFTEETLFKFSQLDDNDIISAIKSWVNHSDFVLSELSSMILNRKLPKVTISKEQISEGVF
jgi:hypothetical protein